MDKLIKYLDGLPPSTTIVVLFLLIVLMAIYKSKTIVNGLKLLVGKGSKKPTRTYGDFAIILLSIRERYEVERRRVNDELLRQQMTYTEHKLQEIVFFLAQDFNDDIQLLGKDSTNARKVTESALYCEALKNGLLTAKDELRRSFKENGFHSYSQIEFTQYVKEKTTTVITYIRSYLRQYHIETEESIVKLKKRFEKMDHQHLQFFEGWLFDIFSYARDKTSSTHEQKTKLEKKCKEEIDEFVKENKTK